MAEIVNQQKSRPREGAAPAAHDVEPVHPIAQMVKTMLAGGRRSVEEIAAILRANPVVQNDILALLHATCGNLFVNSVVKEAASPTASPEAAVDNKAADVQLGPVRVTARRLRVRRTASTKDDNIVGSLAKGKVVTALAKDGAWIQIEHEGQTAYIHGDHVDHVDAPPGAAKAPTKPHAAAEDEEVAPPAATQAQAPPPAAPPPKSADTPGPSVAPAAPPRAETPVPTPTPAPTPAPKSETKANEPRPVEAGTAKKPDGEQKAAPSANKDFFEKVYKAGSGKHFQQVQVFVSPGGLSATPNVFLFFHGYDAQYGIDPSKKKQKGVISGLDTAEQAMRQARDKNTVAILPQGVIGRNHDDRSKQGGFMEALAGGLPDFIKSVLGPLADDLQMEALAPGKISIAGHSAGGYMGVHDAMAGAGALADTITDVTLMDTSYSSTHFKDTAKWMYAGKAGKSVRIIGTKYQLTDPEKKAFTFGSFGPGVLKTQAAANGFTFEDAGGAGGKRDAHTTVVQHSRIKRPDGEVQCDVLILKYDKTGNAGLDHHPLRDRVMDDSILSIGEGAAGNDTFGSRDQGVLPGQAQDARAGEVAPAGAEHDDDSHDAAPQAVKQPTPEPPPKVEQPKLDPAAKPPDPVKEPAKKGPPKKEAAPKAAKPKKGDKVDAFGNLSERINDSSKAEIKEDTFKNSFTVIGDATMYDGKGKKLKDKLADGTTVYVRDMNDARVQIVSSTYAVKDDVWVDFSSLGGKGADVGLGNEKTDEDDKARADKIREGLPPGRKPGKSKHHWGFSGHFKPSLDGIALAGSLMGKVHALMEWAIQNDMVVGNIKIGDGMRAPKRAHYMCVRYELANMDTLKHVTMANLKALPGGKDKDGNKWYEDGWTQADVIAYAKAKLKAEGASGKPAAAGYNFGNDKRLPLPLGDSPGVSRHCSGHAVDVDIPWRSEKDPSVADKWGWEHIYHQFGLTRPLHRSRVKPALEESWHIEETGKAIAVEGEAKDDD